MRKLEIDDVIILLPGVTGSALRKDGKDVWAPTGGAVTRALFSLGGNIKALQLGEDSPDKEDLGDGVEAVRLIPDIHLIPRYWKIDGYSRIVDTIKAHFAVEVGKNYFEFAYDWRRDNTVAAKRLARQVRDWLRSWRETRNPNARLILIAHSMGGLVARYFLECLGGWRDTSTLVTFGTPFRGSLNALDSLVNGYPVKLGGITLSNLSELVRSFTSTYQLLPVYECCTVGDEVIYPAHLTGLDEKVFDRKKALAGLAFHQAIRNAEQENLKDPLYRQARYAIHPIVGMFQPTLQSARVTGGRVEMLWDRAGRDEGGDNTVPRLSATPDGSPTFPGTLTVSGCHAALQNGKSGLDHLVGILSGQQLHGLPPLCPPPPFLLSLRVNDACPTGAPVTILGRSTSEEADLRAVVADAETGKELPPVRLGIGPEGWRQARVGPLPEGTYRVTLRDEGPDGIDPVTDVFVVLPPAP
jgi:hypothetical protein